MILQQLKKEWKIPDLSESRLEKLVKQIKPIVSNSSDNDKLYYIEDVDPVEQAFTWDPTFTDESKELMLIGKTYSLHSSYPGLWKPSMEEVFAFIQNHKDIDKVVAISISAYSQHQSGNGNIGLVSLYSNK